jgi:hypothetical protein
MIHALAEKFMARFRGLNRAHGSYTITGHTTDKGKISGAARTLKEMVTLEHWSQHLLGREGLGIVPIMDNGMCHWGALDIDSYDLNLELLEAKVRRFQLPLVVCRTKSGGAHLFLFLKEEEKASFIRDTLMEWAVLLGHPRVEIFPKQSELAGEDDCGSWLNMPYYDAERTTRYAIYLGNMLTAEEFLQNASMMATSAAYIKTITERPSDEDEDFKGGPPCLQLLIRSGIPEGNRNLSLFNIGVLFRLREDDDWERKLYKINETLINPMLPTSEVDVIIKSLKKKKYFYKCKEPPIVNLCNKAVCSKKQFGIRRTNDDPGVLLDGMVKIMTDPPYWLLNVDGKRVKMMSSDDFLNQHKFKKTCVDSHSVMPRMIENAIWDDIVRDLLAHVEEQTAPEDTGPKGEFMSLLEKFCTERTPARHEDEILTGKPYQQNGRILFRSPDMLEWMRKRKFSITAREAWSALRDCDAMTLILNLKGKQVRVWSLPAFTRQDEPLSEEPIFDEEEF